MTYKIEEITGPDPVFVQAVADLLAARTKLYDQQPGHPLVARVDETLRQLMSPTYLVTSGDQE